LTKYGASLFNASEVGETMGSDVTIDFRQVLETGFNTSPLPLYGELNAYNHEIVND